MTVWILHGDAPYEENGIEGVYTDPEAAALDIGIPLHLWDRDHADNTYELRARDLILCEWEALDSAGVLAEKQREATEEATRRRDERSRRWIK